MRTTTNYKIIEIKKAMEKVLVGWSVTKKNGSKNDINGRKKLQNEEKIERTRRCIAFAAQNVRYANIMILVNGCILLKNLEIKL